MPRLTRRPRPTAIIVATLAAFALTLAACGDDDDSADDTTETTESAAAGTYDEALGAEVVAHYAEGVHASYETSVASAVELQTAIDAFLAAPDDATLQAAKDAWLSARDDYGVTEAFRFYGGPIDHEEDGPEGQINAWPLDEAYIDYVEGDPTAGMINDPSVELTAESLAAANEQGGETNISTGWHAIEFLLWGQDLSADGPGARPVTDYSTSPSAERRGEYLKVVTDLLVADLESLVAAWDPDAGDNYYAEFVEEDTDESLTQIITGIGELSRGELAGERMTVAYEERSQEDEHSCFSDNTTADLQANQNGIIAVWTGSYPNLAGPGVEELVADVDEELAAKTTADMEASIAEIEQIPAPFDSHLGEDVSDDEPGRQAILTSTELLSVQTDDLVDSAEALGLTIEVS